VLLAERSDESSVRGLVAVAGEDGKVSLLAVEGLGALTETANNAIVDDRLLQDDLDGLNDIGDTLVNNISGTTKDKRKALEQDLSEQEIAPVRHCIWIS